MVYYPSTGGPSAGQAEHKHGYVYSNDSYLYDQNQHASCTTTRARRRRRRTTTACSTHGTSTTPTIRTIHPPEGPAASKADTSNGGIARLAPPTKRIKARHPTAIRLYMSRNQVNGKRIAILSLDNNYTVLPANTTEDIARLAFPSHSFQIYIHNQGISRPYG